MPPPSVTDAERFAALFRRHYAAVHRFALRRSDPSSAEDVTNATFATCWRRWDRVPADEPLPWLLVTARHELANRARANRHADDKARRASAGVVTTSRDPAELLAERDRVVGAFLRLSESDREALRLVAWDGLALADAARVAGTSRATFAVRVHRARRRLAAWLEEPPSASHCPHATQEVHP